MKYIMMMLLLAMPVWASAEQTKDDDVHQVEKQNVFKGLMYKVWNKFRVLSPKNTNDEPRTVTTTAGIRGAETTTSLLKPYWKDDKTQDEGFLKQLNDFADAQAMVEKGELQQADQAFRQFMDTWPDSDLRPNAEFALGMTLGGMGQNTRSVEAFQTFIKSNPKHPLVADAQALITELK